MAFTLKINGTPHKVDVDGDTPQLWVLRDVLGMTGTKFGCGAAVTNAIFAATGHRVRTLPIDTDSLKSSP